MTNITIIFKSGKEISFFAENFTVKTVNGQMMGYSFDGAKFTTGAPMYLNMDEVAAIMQKQGE